MQRMVRDIEEVATLTTEMGSLALSMLEDSVNALDKDDPNMMERMKTSRTKILELDTEIEMKAFRILMIYQPMAADMRLVATILKMTTYFERLGKYGYNIAKYHIDLRDGKGMSAFKELSEMGKIAGTMVENAVESFKTRDISKLNTYEEMEIKVDALRRKILAETLQFMKEHPEMVDEGNKIITASRYLERAGDYACKLAEKITFMVSGERVERH